VPLRVVLFGMLSGSTDVLGSGILFFVRTSTDEVIVLHLNLLHSPPVIASVIALSPID
jgi:hypothetical protein